MCMRGCLSVWAAAAASRPVVTTTARRHKYSTYEHGRPRRPTRYPHPRGARYVGRVRRVPRTDGRRWECVRYAWRRPPRSATRTAPVGTVSGVLHGRGTREVRRAAPRRVGEGLSAVLTRYYVMCKRGVCCVRGGAAAAFGSRTGGLSGGGSDGGGRVLGTILYIDHTLCVFASCPFPLPSCGFSQSFKYWFGRRWVVGGVWLCRHNERVSPLPLSAFPLPFRVLM